MGLYTLIKPISLNDVPNVDAFTLFLGLPILLGVGIWAYQMSFFRLEKQKGNNWQLNSLRDEMLHLLVIGALALIPFMLGHQLSDRIEKQISQQALVDDINILKTGGQFLLSDENDYTYYAFHLPSRHWGLEGELFEYEVEQHHLNLSSSCKKRQLIEEFRFVFEKYSGYMIPYSAHEILSIYKDESEKLDLRDFEYHFENLIQNITYLADAHIDDYEVDSKDSQRSLIFFCFMLWLGLQAFLKTNWKTFLGTAILAAVWALGIALTTSLVDASFNIPRSDKVALSLILCSTAFFLYQGYRNKNTKRMHILKVVSLTLGTMLIPIIPLVLAGLLDTTVHGDSFFHLLFAGMGVGFIAWTLTLRSRFVKLMAIPKEN